MWQVTCTDQVSLGLGRETVEGEGERFVRPGLYSPPSWKNTRVRTVGVLSVVCTGTTRSTVRPSARAALFSVILTSHAGVPAPYV